MSTLEYLPPEVLLKIFHYLPIRDILKTSQTCKAFNIILNADIFWEKKTLFDYNIRLNVIKNDESGFSPKDFFSKIIYPYAKLIGLWQVSSYGHYGGIFQVSTYQIYVH